MLFDKNKVLRIVFIIKIFSFLGDDFLIFLDFNFVYTF